MIVDLIGQNAANWLLGVALFGAMFSSLWASIKVSYERIKQKPFPQNNFTLVLDIATDLLPNLPGLIHQVAKSQGSRLFMSQNEAPRATFTVNQRFAEGFDPDKVAAQFAKDLEKASEKRFKSEAPDKGQ